MSMPVAYVVAAACVIAASLSWIAALYGPRLLRGRIAGVEPGIERRPPRLGGVVVLVVTAGLAYLSGYQIPPGTLPFGSFRRLELLLAVDGARDILCVLKVDEAIDFVLRGEARRGAGPMLLRSAQQVVRYADVEDRARLVRHDVHVIVVLSHE